MFSPEVCNRIGYYIYLLLDGDEAFYVGKGQGNRAFQHAIAAVDLSLGDEDPTSAKLERIRHIRPLSPRSAVFTLSIVLTMFALHGQKIWIFAFTYWGLGAVQDLESALYFSTISYSTVGYNDIHILAEWRLLGAFESILGIFLLGWSTALFFRMLGRIDPH